MSVLKLTHLLVNGKYRNLLSVIVFGLGFLYLFVPFGMYYDNVQEVHTQTLIASNSDTIRSIIMILIGYYFGSSDYSGNTKHQVTTQEKVDTV